MSYISFENVSKSYKNADFPVYCLQGVNLQIEKGSFTCVYGPSGAGKTTVLNLIAGISRTDSGTITVNETKITDLNERALSQYRKREIGTIYGETDLLQSLTAYENVKTAISVAGTKESAGKLLNAVGFDGDADGFPTALTSLQRARVSLAMALSKHAEILLCDNVRNFLPTDDAETFIKLLKKAVQNIGITVVLATDNENDFDYADSIINLNEL